MLVITNYYIFSHLFILVLGKPVDLIKEVWSSKGVLITTYNGLLQHINHLLKNDWHYVILDEGHKIRNPDSKVSSKFTISFINLTFLTLYLIYIIFYVRKQYKFFLMYICSSIK